MFRRSRTLNEGRWAGHGRAPALELWGGAECTVNRVGGCFGDQVRQTGHHRRASDIELFAELGLSAVRFPILWERISPNAPDACDWTWTDNRLPRLRALGIRVIAGLVHHGSGPARTSLLDDGFAPGLASFAEQVARRYPWISEWTPVNEPLTTARFSALYGHWHPHKRDERLFWTTLLNQIDAVRLAMRAVRKVNSCARLVQTDDLGRTYGTTAVAEQVGFDNTRRWMTWDLLSGRVTPEHDLWKRLCHFGLEDRLRAILDDHCPPDVVGINHYLTSDRFLDHRIQSYPEGCRGGNSQRPFADVEAVRVLNPGPQGLRGAVEEAWSRYRLPIALTEVHNGCTREEQLRWTYGAWRVACEARNQGIELCAITSWALFGNQGWNTLLTSTGQYEPGAYDVSGGRPRRTALVRLLKDLREGEAPHLVVRGAGWWRRDIRLLHPPAQRPASIREYAGRQHESELLTPPILILGATGTLGRAMAAACQHRGLVHVLTGRSELDLLDPKGMRAAIERHEPWAIINCSGWVRVDEAEISIEECTRVNAEGAAALAQACDARAIQSISFSSDLVFDGSKSAPYVESDPTSPLSVYGKSKAAMEERILALDGQHLIIRTAAFFSPFDQANFAVHAVNSLAKEQSFLACSDHIITPTYVPDLCNAALDLIIDGETGIWHLSNQDTLSWAEFAVRIAQACGLDETLVEAVPADGLGWEARRPAASGIVSERGRLMPTLHSAIGRFAAHCSIGEMVRA